MANVRTGGKVSKLEKIELSSSNKYIVDVKSERNVEAAVELNVNTDANNLSKQKKQRPKFRGRIHQVAFYVTLILFPVFVVKSSVLKLRIASIIYFSVQLLLFGISHTYHTRIWTPRSKEIIRRLDHSCIFFLISGTQTSVMLSTIKITRLVVGVIVFSWLSAVSLAILMLTMKRKKHGRTTFLYVIHGLVGCFTVKRLYAESKLALLFVVLGGVFYIIGAVVYATKRPVIYRQYIEYHELFHVFTLLGNSSFGLIIAANVFKKIEQ